jgi:hypothetical protein
MPPPAPSTATLVCRAELVEKARVWVDKRRVAERVNMTDESKGVDAGGTKNITDERLSRCYRSSTQPPFSESRAELPAVVTHRAEPTTWLAIKLPSRSIIIIIMQWYGDMHWRLVLHAPKSRYIGFPTVQALKKRKFSRVNGMQYAVQCRSWRLAAAVR